ncbi:MAG: YHS domain-containing protein [Desulfobacteraceae bacterium]|nr:YHS domain-containing protein [Desulfobacteraceae bacterium]MBU4054532.1 hypothetical protein [Pseudomonadota bacterium]
MILRILVYSFIFYMVYRILKSLVGKNSQKGNAGYDYGRPEPENVLIKDPVCGVYFPKKDGISLREKGKEIYFCSQECKDKHVGQRKD